MSNEIDFSHLVDQDAIAKWKADHDAGYVRKQETANNLETAAAGHRKALAASERAVSGNGDAMAAEIGLETATRSLTVSRKIASAAEAAFLRLQQREALVRGMAHRELYMHGVAQRVAAAKAGDAARAALATAEAAYEAGTETMRAACRAGCSDVHGALNELGKMKTEADERAHWAARRANPDDAGSHPWKPE